MATKAKAIPVPVREPKGILRSCSGMLSTGFSSVDELIEVNADSLIRLSRAGNAHCRRIELTASIQTDIEIAELQSQLDI